MRKEKEEKSRRYEEIKRRATRALRRIQRQGRMLDENSPLGEGFEDANEQGEAAALESAPSKMVGNAGSNNLAFVEEAIPKFSGTDKTYPVSRWAQEIEDNSEIFGLTPLQQLIIARRTLTSTAATWLRSEKPFKTFADLKTALSREFPDSINSKEVHELMATRKKRKDETCYDFMLEMKAIGKRGKFPDYIAIQYIIDGIVDSEANKIMLYGVTTYSDLKEKLKLYEMLKEKSKKNSSMPMGKSLQGVRCFNCGDMDHTSSRCPHRSKGLKCFRCNNYGHISSQCNMNIGTSDKVGHSTAGGVASGKNRSQLRDMDGSVKQLCVSCTTNTTSSSHESIKQCVPVPSTSALDGATGDYDENPNVIMAVSDRDVNNKNNMKTVLCQGVPICCLIDSGSDLNLIKSSLFFELGFTGFSKDNVLLSGLGEKQVSSLGKFDTSIEIDGQMFQSTLHIVSDNVIPYNLILGQELLRNVVVVMDRGSVRIFARDDTWLGKINCFVGQETICCTSDPQIRQQVKELVDSYVPEKSKEAPIEMKIILADDVPVAQRPRRLSIMENKEVDRQIGEWLQNGIIRHSFSEYASPLVLVKKKDGTLRVCVDYRKINSKMVKDEFPLPVIEDHIDRLTQVKVFSKLDLKNAFFHLRVSEESIKYTSFVTPSGQYEFLKAPFGLSICPKYFTRFINIIFRDLVAKGFLLIFIDDLLVLSTNVSEGLERLREVLKVAREYGLEMNWKKCELLTTKVEYLGHVIENGTVTPTSDKIKAVANFPEPKTLKQLHSFIGLTSYFRKYIQDFALIAAPLTKLLRKDQTFQFTDVERQAFQILKQKLCEKPVLKIYNPDLPTELHTDASMHAYAAILMQQSPEDGEMHPVYYSSCKTTESEKKYTSYELEALAVVEGVKKFRKYLLGIPFKIVTDCAAFEMTLRKKDLVTRVARWVLLLQDYDYTVEHRSGTKMRHVDALSRVHFTGMITRQLHERIKRAQESDEGLKAIIEILQEKPYLDYFIENGLLYKSEQKLLVIPKDMEMEIIRRAHEIGHFGKRKMIGLINKDYFIKDLTRKIEDFILTCIPCILATKKEGKQEGFLNPIDKEGIPLSTLHLDHLGPLTETKKLYNYILTVIDAFTKFVWIFPTKSTTTKETLDKLKLHQQCFGNPSRIITDRGAAFTSNDFKEYCESENIHHVTITTGVPRGNGQVERVHRIIVSVLTKLCIEEPGSWYKHVNKLQRAINGTYQRSISTTPFELMIGTKIRMKEDTNLLELLEKENSEEYVNQRENLREAARVQISKIQEENKRNYDKNRKQSRQYQVGDLVAIKKTQFGTHSKLKPKFLGPYKVVRIKGRDRYDVSKVHHMVEGPNSTSTSSDNMKQWPGF